MLVQIAYAVVNTGDVVLRATPEGVRMAVEHAKGEVIFSLEREVHSGDEEFAELWSLFLVKAKQYDKSEFVEHCCKLFFRKGQNLWTTLIGVPNVAIFPSWGNDMIVQVSKATAH